MVYTITILWRYYTITILYYGAYTIVYTQRYTMETDTIAECTIL